MTVLNILERTGGDAWWLSTWGHETDLPPAWGFPEVLLSFHIVLSLTHSHRDQRKLKLNNCLLQGHFLLKCLEYFSLPRSQFFNIIREGNHYETTAHRLWRARQKFSIPPAPAFMPRSAHAFVMAHRVRLWSAQYTKAVALPCLTSFTGTMSPCLHRRSGPWSRRAQELCKHSNLHHSVCSTYQLSGWGKYQSLGPQFPHLVKSKQQWTYP